MKTVFELALLRAFRQKLTIALMGVFPLVLIFLPQPAGMTTPALSYGIFGLVMLFSAFLLSKQLIEDRQYRTIVRIAAAPISHRAYLLGHLLAYGVLMGVQLSVFWVLSLFRWDAPTTFYLYGYLTLVVFAVTAISFCLFWHAMFRTYATSISIFSIVANLMAVVGGMSFPLQFLPDRLRQVAIVLPTYWYAYALELLGEGASLTFGLSLMILLGFAIIFVTIGSKRRFA
ncbi:MAG: ABC transporter permease [Acholeplasmatales bacterium]|nr:MAG: ABC transporter permease [Acholeplasmatales bacterium]